MTCKHCQAELAEGSNFCNQCGMWQDEPAQEENTEVTPVEETVAEETAVEEVQEISEEIEEAAEETAEETEESEKPAPRKKTWVKVTAIVLCVVLLLGLAAGVWTTVNGGLMPRENNLFYKDNYTVKDEKAISAMDQIVATCGDTQLTNSQLQVFYWMQVFSFLENYSYYLNYFGLDYTQPLSEQMMDEETTWEQYFLKSALNNWHRFEALLAEAEEKGFQMPATVDEYLAQLPQQMQDVAASYGYTSVNELLAQDMGVGCDMDDYMVYMGQYARSMEYMDHLYAQTVPTEAQIRAYVEANGDLMMNEYGVSLESGKLVDVRHVLIQPEGCEFDEKNHVVATEDQWEACRVQAQALLDGWLAAGGTEESFAQLAVDHSADGNAASGGIYTDVNKGKMVAPFENWCFDESRQYGDSGLVRTEYGYHIMFFVAAEEGWVRYGTEAYIVDACNTIIETAMEQYPMEVNYKKISLGTAKSLVTE